MKRICCRLTIGIGQHRDDVPPPETANPTESRLPYIRLLEILVMLKTLKYFDVNKSDSTTYVLAYLLLAHLVSCKLKLSSHL